MNENENNNQRMYVIPAGLAQGILDYLTTKPYVEVHEFVHGLQRLARLAPPPGRKEQESEKPHENEKT